MLKSNSAWQKQALDGERDALADISNSNKVDLWLVYRVMEDEFPDTPYSLAYRDTVDTRYPMT